MKDKKFNELGLRYRDLEKVETAHAAWLLLLALLCSNTFDFGFSLACRSMSRSYFTVATKNYFPESALAALKPVRRESLLEMLSIN